MSFGPIRLTLALLLAAAATVGGVTTAAQTAAPAAPTQPRPQPRGGYPLPALPAVFETFQQKVRVSVVAQGLDRPWSLVMLPDGDMLVSMRFANEIRAIRKGVLDPKPLAGLPPMRRIFDVAIHPKLGQPEAEVLARRSKNHLGGEV